MNQSNKLAEVQRLIELFSNDVSHRGIQVSGRRRELILEALESLETELLYKELVTDS